MSSPTPVTDRLQRLAEHAPARLGDPDELWSRGRRRQRAWWLGSASALVVLAVLGAVALPPAFQRSQAPVAVSPDSALRLPDLVRQPGAWEPAFPHAPGRLVAVGLGTRAGWRSSRNAWWGVSASTGESRFLDLPEAVVGTGAAPALSADGRYLAYWFSGETIGQPLVIDGMDPAVGVAVVDLVTGDEEKWKTGTRRGLKAYGLAWAGDVLWWSGGAFSEDSTPTEYGASIETYTWDLATGDQLESRAAGVSHELAGRGGSAPGGMVLRAGRRNALVVVAGAGNTPSRLVRPDTTLVTQESSGPVVSPDGTRLAGMQLDPEVETGEPVTLVVGELGSDTTQMERVGDVRTTAVLGWRSSDEVVVETYRGDDLDRVYGAAVVDVDTAEVTPLVDFRGNVPSFAADAWSAEVIEAPDAPWAPDPRLLGAAVLILGTFVVSLANSVRRRRAGA